MQKITPNLWFDNNVEEAVKLYTSIFKNSKIGQISHYDKASAEVSGQPEGSILTISFQLEGQDFVALNGGPAFKFTEAISLSVDCQTQDEIDTYTEKLLAGGGEQGPCGWLKDKFGLSWQITPSVLNDMLQDSDKEKAGRAMKAMLGMKKLDIAELQKAYDGE